MPTLTVATVQFAETWSPAGNLRQILKYIESAGPNADVVHFHEGALSGYLAHTRSISLDHVDWQAIQNAMEQIRQAARRVGTWVVVGSAHPLTPPHLPHNCLYLISPGGEIEDRYDKRFLTPADVRVFSPGDHEVIFTINGIKCALLICYEVRFPELYRRLCAKGVQMIFQSFHNAHAQGPSVHEKIMRQTMQAHAGMNYFWASACNSSAYYSSYPSVFITPDGAIKMSLPRNKSGVMINTVDTSQEFYDASGPYRQIAIDGATHNSTLVTDPRSSNRRLL